MTEALLAWRSSDSDPWATKSLPLSHLSQFGDEHGYDIVHTASPHRIIVWAKGGSAQLMSLHPDGGTGGSLEFTEQGVTYKLSHLSKNRLIGR